MIHINTCIFHTVAILIYASNFAIALEINFSRDQHDCHIQASVVSCCTQGLPKTGVTICQNVTNDDAACACLVPLDDNGSISNNHNPHRQENSTVNLQRVGFHLNCKNGSKTHIVCIEKCPAGTVRWKGLCFSKCPNGTLTFSTDSFNHSLRTCVEVCPADTFVHMDSCLSECPVSHPYTMYGLRKCLSVCPPNNYVSDKLCIPCDEACANCTGPTDVECVQCKRAKVKLSSLVTKCVSYCPVSHPYEHETTHECTKGCDTYIITESRRMCVYSCPSEMPFVEQGQCVKNCSLRFRFRHPVKMQIECLKSCLPNYVREPGSNICLSKCHDPLTYKWNGVCRIGCPTIAPFVYSANKECTKACEGKMDCHLYCPPGVNFTLGDQCKYTCPLSHPYHISGERECFQACPDGMAHIPNQSVCYTSCTPELSFIDQGLCVEQCPKKRKFIYNQTCLETCPLGMVHEPDIFTCLQSCPDNLPYEYNRTCIVTCPTSAPIIYENACFSECPKYLVNLNNTCTTHCSSEKPINFNHTCLRRCPPSYPYYGSGWNYITDMCSQSCHQNVVNISGQLHCQQYCTEEFPYSWNQTCMKSCPREAPLRYPISFSFMCTPVCPPDYKFTNEFTMECQERCSKWVIAENSTCVDVCPSTLLMYNVSASSSLGKCVQSCPHNMYAKNSICIRDVPTGLGISSNIITTLIVFSCLWIISIPFCFMLCTRRCCVNLSNMEALHQAIYFFGQQMITGSDLELNKGADHQADADRDSYNSVDIPDQNWMTPAGGVPMDCLEA